MALTPEEKRIRQRAATKRYQERHPEKCAAAQAKWRAASPDYTNEWNKKNPEKVRAARAKTNAKPEVKEWRKNWKSNNPERVRLYVQKANSQPVHREAVRKHRAKHIDALRLQDASRARRIRSENAAEYKAKRRVWEQANRELLLSYCAKRRSATTNKLSRGLVKVLMSEQGGKCPYCFRSLKETGYSLDHYMPLALGGPHIDENIQLTCKSCNSAKRDKPPMKFLAEVTQSMMGA